MRIRKYYIALILLMLGVGIARSQELRKEIRIDFRVNVTSIDSAYSDNAAHLRDIVNYLRQIKNDSTVAVLDVSFCGAASPEGSDQLNRRLARGRLTSLENLIRKKVDIPDSIISRNDSYIPWEYLKEQIEKSDLAHKDEVIAILDEESQLVDYHHPNTHIDNRVVKLKQIDEGRVWQQMNRMFFRDMRNASVVFITYKKLGLDLNPTVAIDTVSPQPEPEPVVPADTVPVEDDEFVWTPQVHVKTNFIGLGLGIVNAGVEFDLTNHWSVALSCYYSGWDYFRETLKFRVNSVYLEGRYWLSPFNTGFFAGAHVGMAYYNFAFDGFYRYQDHDTESPAYGGGLTLGYRLPLSKNRKWNLEFALGAGCYHLYYNTFYNVDNGRLAGVCKDTYWGIDQAGISLSYAFDLKKKKGGKR